MQPGLRQKVRGGDVEHDGLLGPVRGFGDADVGRFQIEVEQSRSVRGSESFGDLRAELERARRNDAAALAQLVRQRQLAAALIDEEEGGDEVHAGVHRPRDVRVIELGGSGRALRLGEEALHGVGIGRVAAQQLEDHRAALRVLGQPGVRESAGAELHRQPISGDLGVLQRRGRLGMRETVALVAQGLAAHYGRERRAAVCAGGHRARS